LDILAISALLIAALMINFRVLNVGNKSDAASVVISQYVNIIWLALPILFISGSILIVGEPARSLANPAFQMKIIMLLMVIAITLSIQKIRAPNGTPLRSDRKVKLLAVLSLMLWFGIVACGRWIAYT